MSYSCPHCGQRVLRESRPQRVICPRCFEIFQMPSANQWILGIVPIAAFQYLILFGF